MSTQTVGSVGSRASRSVRNGTADCTSTSTVGPEQGLWVLGQQTVHLPRLRTSSAHTAQKAEARIHLEITMIIMEAEVLLKLIVLPLLSWSSSLFSLSHSVGHFNIGQSAWLMAFLNSKVDKEWYCGLQTRKIFFHMFSCSFLIVDEWPILPFSSNFLLNMIISFGVVACGEWTYVPLAQIKLSYLVGCNHSSHSEILAFYFLLF